MKKMKIVVILALLCLVIPAQAAITVEDNETSAGAASNERLMLRQSVGGEVVAGREVKFFPAFGPTIDPQKTEFWKNGVNHVETHGTLPEGERTGPADVRLLHAFSVDDLISSTVPYYRGVFNPPAPWDNERGGTIWWFLDIQAGTNETITLTDIVSEIESNDRIQGLSTNILGRVYSFGPGNTYSSTALGINPDGSRVADGTPAHVGVKRIIIAIGTKHFKVASASDEQEIRNYSNLLPDFAIKNTVSFKGTSVSMTLTKARLRLSYHIEGETFFIDAEDTGDFNGYWVQRSVNLVDWEDFDMIRAGESVPVQDFRASPMGFFRIKP